MGRGKVWLREEEEILVENVERCTIKELMNLLPSRSQKAINRKIEKLRDEGVVGYRRSDSRRRSFYQR